MTAPLLSALGLEVGYDGRAFLPPIDCAVSPGQIWAIIGRNGGGKSTVLKTVLGLLPRVAGEIERAPDLRLAYVPQRDDHNQSVPGRVIDIVHNGMDRGWSFLWPGFMRDAGPVRRALEAAGLVALRRHPFATLSEGQKQRVLVARALASDPQILLLDEPTSAMDPIHEEAIFALLHDLAHARNLAIVVVSHQLSFVPRFATHMLLVDKDDGTVEAGPRTDVLACDACRQKYGDLLPDG